MHTKTACLYSEELIRPSHDAAEWQNNQRIDCGYYTEEEEVNRARSAICRRHRVRDVTPASAPESRRTLWL